MATCAKTRENDNTDRRKQILVGDLPGDFLRLSVNSQHQQQAADEQAAIALQQQLSFAGSPGSLGRLTISVVEAKLNKNYGVTRMDPYVRLRLGHIVYETPTDYNGAKNPRWNKSFQCLLPSGVNTVNVEVYDECAFSVDEKIGWCNYILPEKVLKGGTAEEWLLLDGRLGEGKEGAISLVFSYAAYPTNSVMYPQPAVIVQSPYYGVMPGVPGVVPVPGVMPGVVPYYAPGAYPVGQYAHPGQQQQQQQQWRQPPVKITEEDIKQLQEMFPLVEKDVIIALLEEYAGNKDKSISALLQMTADT